MRWLSNTQAPGLPDSPIKRGIAVIKATGKRVFGCQLVFHKNDNAARFIGVALTVVEVQAAIGHSKATSMIVNESGCWFLNAQRCHGGDFKAAAIFAIDLVMVDTQIKRALSHEALNLHDEINQPENPWAEFQRENRKFREVGMDIVFIAHGFIIFLVQVKE